MGRADAALVTDRGPQQGHVAARGGIQATLVDDAAGSAISHEAVVAAHEVGIAQAEGTSHQCAGIDPGALTEHDPIGIDDVDVPVRADLSIDLGRVGGQHPVECRRAAVGLVEDDLALAADIEAAPVDRDVLAGLCDVELVVDRRSDGRTARRHATALRQGIGRRGSQSRPGCLGQGAAPHTQGRHQQRNQLLGTEFPQAFNLVLPRFMSISGHRDAAPFCSLPTGNGDLRHHHPRAAALAPNQSVGLVHESVLGTSRTMLDYAGSGISTVNARRSYPLSW